MTQTSRIFLVAHAGKPRAVELLERLTEWLGNRGMLAGTDLEGRPESIREAKPDYVIALGGDGTILHAGQAMQQEQVPIIGVNLGKLGYLADFDERELQACLDQILANPQLVSKRLMFNVSVNDANGDAWEGVALNDCVVRAGAPFRTMSLEILVDSRPLCTLAGDGVILATPTGSTAHNLSCGGPILEPALEGIVVTPMCAHSFTHRPVVVSPNSEVLIRMASDVQGAAAVLDGQCVRDLEPGSSIVVSRSKASFQLVRNPARTSWDTLITKLKWGQDVT